MEMHLNSQTMMLAKGRREGNDHGSAMFNSITSTDLMVHPYNQCYRVLDTSLKGMTPIFMSDMLPGGVPQLSLPQTQLVYACKVHTEIVNKQLMVEHLWDVSPTGTAYVLVKMTQAYDSFSEDTYKSAVRPVPPTKKLPSFYDCVGEDVCLSICPFSAIPATPSIPLLIF